MNETENNQKPFKDIEFKSLIVAFKGMLIIFFIVISLILIFSIKSQAITQDINYTFNKSTPYDDYDNIIMDTYNLRHSNTITQNYSATYDFLNESIGISIPNEWINSSTNGYIEIVDNYEGHNKVVKLNDVNDGQVSFYQSLSDINYGTIEYWMLNNDMTNGRLMLWLFHGSNELFRVYLRDDLVRAYNGAFQDCGYASEGIMIHISIDFECTLGGYKGLNQYEFRVFNNEVGYGAFSFINNEVHIDKIEFLGSTATTTYYIDAIGYSWDSNYTIGQNIIPDIIIEPLTRLKPNRYEFAMNKNGYRFADNVQDPSLEGWDNVYGVNVYTDNIATELGSNVDFWEYGLRTHGHVSLGAGIINDTIRLQDDQINITFGLRYFDISNLNSKINLWIKSLNGSDIVFVRIETITSNKASVQYLDNNEVYQDIIDIYGINNPLSLYEFNLFIDDFDVNLLYYVNNTYNSSHSFPLKEITKGMSYISLTAYDNNVDDFTVRFEYCGLYQYNISLCNEFGYLSYNLTNTWNLKYHNLLTINCLDYALIYASNVPYQYDRFIDDWDIPLRSINNTNFFNNTYYWSGGIPHIFEPIGYLQLITNSSGIDYSLIDFSIEGVKLSNDINDYYPSYSSNGINRNENYFYTSNNQLKYTHTSNENDTLEYIQAYFNIDNEYCLNSSINFNSYFLGISKAYFIVNFVSETNFLFDIPIGNINYNDILPQQQIIKSFTFLITDNDNNDYYGNSDGYFSSIKLIYYPDIELTILTLSLVEILIPLIVLIIPTLAIASVYGKKTIIPMLILMSIICYIGGLIELWLLTVMLMCLGSFLFIEYKRERGV